MSHSHDSYYMKKTFCFWKNSDSSDAPQNETRTVIFKKMGFCDPDCMYKRNPNHGVKACDICDYVQITQNQSKRKSARQSALEVQKCV